MNYEDRLTVAQAELQKAKALIQEELRAYPTPVSGCDAQYNYLIGQQSSIRAALIELAEPRFVATPRMQTAGARVESR